jgi:DHA1 family bicyclomycin/chloramphenicol resistance-like MFS transporter
VIFGGLAVAMAIGMYVNGKIVERFGLDRLIGKLLVANALAVAALLALALATGGTPGIWSFLVAMGTVLFVFQMLVPDLNAAAMKPLAHVAGTAAAILGMIPGVVGSVIGTIIDRQFDGTIMPLTIAYVVGTAVAIVGWRWAMAATRNTEPAMA